MNSIKVIGIDLAKSVFQVCVWMSGGSIAFNRKVSRAKLMDTIRQFPTGSIIAMEVCATSHYWGRTFQSMGFLIRLIPTQHVKAFTHHQKTMPMMRWQFVKPPFAQVFISLPSKRLNSRI